MMMRGGGRRRWVAAAGLSVLLIGLGVFLLRAGLADADRWASVFGVFLNVAGLAVAVLGALSARASATGHDVANQIRGGRFTGPVVQGRDVGPGTPSPRRPATGTVSNRIEDGDFGGPLIQGRDVVPPD